MNQIPKTVAMEQPSGSNGIIHATPEDLAKIERSGINAQDLLRQEFPPLKWAVEGMLPEGLAIIAGKPKVGKSWLVLNLCLAVAAGGNVFGTNKTVAGVAFYLALEDSLRRLQDRLITCGAEVNDTALQNLVFHTHWPNFADGGLEQLDKSIKEKKGTRLVVVDTLQRIRPPQKQGASWYAQDYDTLVPIKKLADEQHITLLLVHHLRKMESEDPLEMMSGSSGLTGAADTLLVLGRPRNNTDGTLYVTGRDLEEQNLAMGFKKENGTWAVIGNAADYDRSPERQKILDILRESDQPMKPKEIADALGVEVNNIQQLLKKLKDEGQVIKPEYGQYWVSEKAAQSDQSSHSDQSDQSDQSSVAELVQASG